MSTPFAGIPSDSDQQDFVALLARQASAVDQRRFTTARASTFDFSMRTDSS